MATGHLRVAGRQQQRLRVGWHNDTWGGYRSKSGARLLDTIRTEIKHGSVVAYTQNNIWARFQCAGQARNERELAILICLIGMFQLAHSVALNRLACGR